MIDRSSLAFVLALLASASADGGAPTAAARFDQGKLWLTSREAPPPLVFSAIAEKTGVRFAISKDLELPPLTVDIEGMALERAIRDVFSKAPGVAGHTMVYGTSRSGVPRLLQVSIFGRGGPRSPATIYETAPSTPHIPPETESKVLSLIRELKEMEARPLGRKDLPPESLPRLEALLDAGFTEEDALVAVFYHERRRRLVEKLAKIPGGLEAFDVLKNRSYYEPEENRARLTSSFSDVWDDL